jgi:ABC-type antimicrobial peptide transport system permease subunit
MRFMPSSVQHLVTGFALAAGVTWLGFLAAGGDDYYHDSVSRWEHATRGGTGAVVLVVVGMTLAGGFALSCVVRGLLPKRLAFALPIVLVIPAYLVAWWVAWFGLAAGH